MTNSDPVRTFAEDNAVLRALAGANALTFNELATRTGFDVPALNATLGRLRATYGITIAGGVITMPRGVYTRKPRTARSHPESPEVSDGTAGAPAKPRRRRAHRNRDTRGALLQATAWTTPLSSPISRGAAIASRRSSTSCAR